MALQGTLGFQYVFLSEPSQSLWCRFYSLETESELSPAFSPCPPQAETEWCTLGSCLGEQPGVLGLMLRRHRRRRHLLFLPALHRQRCFLQTDFINGHVTGWCHLADGLGKVQSVTFIPAVPLLSSLHPLSMGPLNPLFTGWHSPSFRLWITLGPCSSQDSAFLERADYRSPGKL